MQNLNISLANYIKQAKLYLDSGESDKALNCILRAAECALLLAKNSSGKERDALLEKYKSLKDMADSLAVKKGSAAPDADAISDDMRKPAEPVNLGGNGNGGNERRRSGAGRKSDSLSPQWLSDYIGQPQAVTAVRDLIQAALLKDSALPHLILYGSHGLGKTTFANIIANELGVGFTEINVSKTNPAEMIAILKKLKPKDIIFIDEIHTLPLIVAESVLYSAMQDGRITYTEGKGKFAKTETLTLPPFTLIGATTEIGKLAKPFTQRAIQIRLEEYTDEVLSGIVSHSFYRLGMKISGENALYIAKRCRNNPRIANSMVRRISDKALVKYAAMNNVKASGSFGSVEAIRKLNISVAQNVIDEFFEENAIDGYGLEKGDRELLKIIITRYGGGPVGIDTLSKVLNESNNVISQKYEAYLVKKGLMKIERDGRVVMPEAYKVLGLPVPRDAAGTVGADKNEKKSRFDDRKITACRVADGLKCDKLESLIVYPENAVEFTEPLDELFPDIEKPYVEESKHRCYLEIDFGQFKRRLECDSFLESRFASCMAGIGYLKDIKSQSLELPYISQELADRRYFPDFIIKDYKGRIAVIEMKNYEMASYHLNIDKYEMLGAYCKKHGYGYAEIMKANNAETYVSLDMLLKAPVNRQLEQYIFDTIEKNGRETGEGVFTEKDFEGYKKLYGQTPREEIYTILLNNRRLKNTDRIGNDMKISAN